jgi:hypothetical protein
MKVVPFPLAIQTPLNKFDMVGGCVDYKWVTDEGAHAPLEERHRAACVTAVDSLIQENSLPPSLWCPTIYPFQASEIAPTVIGPVDFLGPRWNAENRQVLIQKKFAGRAGYAWFYAREDAGEKNIVRNPDSEAKGYAYAFSAPPYGLQLDGPAMQDLFDAVLKTLLPRLFEPDTHILQWPTSWSSYFDPGQEWWGSFLWTIEQVGFPLLVVTASTTD